MRQELREQMPACLPGFEQINRYWDGRHNIWVAKILPGEFYVSRQSEWIATTLGSCVSACIWDSGIGIGGMNHFMLPLTDRAASEVRWGNLPSDATRYGNYAMEHLINELQKNGGSRRNFQAKVFGGGSVLKRCGDVGDRNADFVLDYLETERIPIISGDLRGVYPRKLLFEARSGRVMMKKLRSIHNDTIMVREQDYRESLTRKPVEGEIEIF